MNLFLLLIFKLYNNVSTVIENYILRKNKVNTHKSDLLTKGFSVFKIKQNKISYEETILVNKYMKKYIIKNYEIKKLLSNIFIKNNLKQILTNQTGYNYSVSYIIAYETFPVIEADKTKGWFANHWHRDKPFSQNTLKVIIPLQDISSKDGGIEICSIESSKINFKHEKPKCKILNFFKFIGSENDLLIFNPNKCFHQAGYPETNHKRKQIMLQLNPSKEWSYCSNLFNKQYKIEPKFPLIRNLFNKFELMH